MLEPLDPTQTGHEAEKLESDLKKRIVGQDEAIDQIINIFQTHLSGLSSPGRPIGNFLFLGPTGTGKTRAVEATAESLIGDIRAVIKINCAEFQHSHEIAKLIGSPPGYLGHRETHPALSQDVLDQYYTEKLRISFVLFDEIEKASDALWNLLLGILDTATLTLGDNRRVDFSRSMVFLTSNLGAREMSSILRPSMGFCAAEPAGKCGEGSMDTGLVDKIYRAGVNAARHKFTPEFMNRIDKTVVFRPLGVPELRKILQIELNVLQQRIFNSVVHAPFVFSLNEDARDFLIAEGTDMRYGARHLKRTIDRELVHPFSNLIAAGQVCGGDLVCVLLDKRSGRLAFYKRASDISLSEMIQMTDGPASLRYSKATAAGTADMTL